MARGRRGVGTKGQEIPLSGSGRDKTFHRKGRVSGGKRVPHWGKGGWKVGVGKRARELSVSYQVNNSKGGKQAEEGGVQPRMAAKRKTSVRKQVQQDGLAEVRISRREDISKEENCVTE